MNKATVAGVGINDVPGARSKYPKEYDIWKHMLRRCYSKNEQSKTPTYIGCSVSEEWKTLSNFLSWVFSQDYQNKQLDKDLLVVGNKLYSKETCVFISKDLNVFIIDKHQKNSELPTGVNKSGDKYQAQINNPFSLDRKMEYLGTFNTAEEAHIAWRLKKHEYAEKYTELETDPRIISALRTRYI